MSPRGSTPRGRWIAAGIALVAIAALELVGPEGGGAIVVTLALWTAAIQGSVAAAAVAELTNARWTPEVKPELLASAGLLPPLALLFLLVWPELGLYPWTAHPGAWLDRPFFFARNLALLVAVAGVALLFAARAARGDPSARRVAVVYLLLFAASQTLVAFDWIMSLSWPWVSSMLGMFFTVEALYLGIAQAGLLFAILARRPEERGGVGAGEGGRDVGLLLFGFSILWGGLFFAQFMLLWYGNLPEEVGFIATRMAAGPTRAAALAFIACCFGLPFLALLSARTKRSPALVAAVSVAVILGVAAERIFLVLPVLPLRGWVFLVENLLLLVAWWGVVALARPAADPGMKTRGGVA